MIANLMSKSATDIEIKATGTIKIYMRKSECEIEAKSCDESNLKMRNLNIEIISFSRSMIYCNSTFLAVINSILS